MPARKEEQTHWEVFDYLPPESGSRCSARPRRAPRTRLGGNEYVYTMLADQNIETLKKAAPTTVVASCPHCFNTIAGEYPQLGGDFRGEPPHPAGGEASPAGPGCC